jgi:hyperosmotically inducible protein
MRVGQSEILIAALVFSLNSAVLSEAQSKRDMDAIHARLEQKVRHELIMLSNYSLFDILVFEVAGLDTVVLSGQVTRPILKSEAESAVLRLEGVGKVVNKIEVLPLSPNDERLRIAAYRAIISKPGLDKYGLRAVPPIHIIVKDGTITLIGNVGSHADKDLAGIAAREVPGAFSVTNNLKVETK